MPALDQGTAIMALNAFTLNGSWAATVTGLKIRLTITAPTATVPGTELVSAGYTAGGLAIAFGAAVPIPAGALALSTTVLSWTNSSVAGWALAGLELWDQAATPVRKAYGLWDNQPLAVAPSAPFALGAGSIGWQFP
jgi:hypothetical protein